MAAGHAIALPATPALEQPLVLWCDAAHDVVENMRRDFALLARLETKDEERTPVLRLFRFDPPGITLGHAQRPEQELDLARCRADGVGWAVRPTGGRAIFHAEEWTFSLAARLDDPVWGGSVAEAYSAIASVVAAALGRLGVPGVMASRASRRPGAESPDPRPREAACFAATARHEILLDGRKLVGCAQRRTSSALLHQGSLLLGDGHLRLADYLAAPDQRRERLRDHLRQAAAHAGDHLGPHRSLDDFAAALTGSLGPRVRRIDGAAGGFLLTLAKPPSYTPACTQPGD